MRAWVIYVLLFLSTSMFAQKRPVISHQIRSEIITNNNKIVSPVLRTNVKILSILVEFQTDSDPQTSGDGKFQVDGSLEQIDPPPHDSTYFKNKIRFVENYFRKVSNGILTVTGSVFPQKIVLSKSMSAYSPPTDENDNSKLANLVVESWTKINADYPGIPFSQYDAFVIFHAGAGRDIELVSSLGYNPTPFDIPSLYLDSTAFANALGVSSFSGISVNGNNIKHTIILPETETHVISTSSGTQTLQLSINGMFAASIASYLGLPDLFDTKTGRSGIGQFGLMDGAGIFAFNGLFPPEPSAWEKIRLGWTNPIEITNSISNVSVPAVGLTNIGQDTIYKISISQSEYFLIENRNRDPEINGQWLDIIKDTIQTRRYFSKDTTGFSFDDISGITGSVVDVENFDWAVIGYMDGSGKYDGGGILIWHIDENIILNALKSNTVNADIEHRGVDLEEADGSQDIGQKYEALTSGSGTENGYFLDYWFEENSAIVYKNKFTGNSFPNSNSYSGAASLITIKDFDKRSPRMKFNVEIGNQILQRDVILAKIFSNANGFPTSTGNHIYLPVDSGLVALSNNGNTLGTIPNVSEAVVYRTPTSDIVIGIKDSTLKIFQFNPHNIISSKIIPQGVATALSVAQLDIPSILVGTENGNVLRYDTSGNLISTYANNNKPVTSFTILPTSISSKPNEYFFTSGNRIYKEQSATVDLPNTSNTWLLAAAVSPNDNNYIVAAEKNGSTVIGYNQDLSKKIFDVVLPDAAIQELAIADINGDGEKDAILQSPKYLSIINRNGIMLDGFPLHAKENKTFNGVPIIVDFNGDTKPEIILFTNDGEMLVYSHSGKLFEGFPIQVTSQGKIFPVAYMSTSNKLGIAVLSESGSLDAFLTSTSVTANSLLWWQQYGDERHSNTDWSSTSIIKFSEEFFPKTRVYNWPNPVYSNSTKIRYYTSEAATIAVTILDLSGVKITELKGRGLAGMDNEITWDVSNIQSGIYLARVEAKSSNKSEVAFIKIAVVK